MATVEVRRSWMGGIVLLYLGQKGQPPLSPINRSLGPLVGRQLTADGDGFSWERPPSENFTQGNPKSQKVLGVKGVSPR